MSSFYADHEFVIILLIGFAAFILLAIAFESFLNRKEEDKRAERRKNQGYRYR